VTANALLQFALLIGVLLLLAKPLGEYLGKVLERDATPLDRLLGPLERGLYRLAGITGNDRMDWKDYALAVLLFNAMGIVFLFLLQKAQGALPYNPQALGAVPTAVAWNTAISFVTNTNWQSYGGETSLSHFTQMAGLTVQNFLSAATGLGVMAALARGIRRRKATSLGSFWVDLIRITLYILLPLAVLFALVLMSQGVVQTLGSNPVAALLSPITAMPLAAEVKFSTASPSIWVRWLMVISPP
jgi:K+-transporting ATPase ATPase A chain